MWYSSFDPILRVLMVGPVAYVLAVVAIRISGRRTPVAAWEPDPRSSS